MTIAVLHFGLACVLMVFLSLVAAGQGENASSTSLNSTNRSDRPVYRLVYWRGRAGQLKYPDKEWPRIREAVIESFAQDLNEKGKDGYRLVSVLIRDLVGLVALDETQYDYRMDESVASYFFSIGDVSERLEDALARNESLISHARLDALCTPINPENIAGGETCTSFHRVITENRRAPVSHQTIVQTIPGWGRSPTADLESAIAEKLKEGYYPVRIISRFAILLQKAGKEDELEASALKLLRTDGNTKDLLKKINEMAAAGYRIALIDDGTALMTKSESAGTTYHFLEGDSKDFAKRFARIESTVKFVTTYPDRQGRMNGLVFESLKPGEKSKTYRFLPFDMGYSENFTKDRIFTTLRPDEAQIDKSIAGLVKQGFRPLTLFVSRPYSILLESN